MRKIDVHKIAYTLGAPYLIVWGFVAIYLLSSYFSKFLRFKR